MKTEAWSTKKFSQFGTIISPRLLLIFIIYGDNLPNARPCHSMAIAIGGTVAALCHDRCNGAGKTFPEKLYFKQFHARGWRP